MLAESLRRSPNEQAETVIARKEVLTHVLELIRTQERAEQPDRVVSTGIKRQVRHLACSPRSNRASALSRG